MFLQTLFSVFVIVCSVDLWILAIVAWSSTHHQTSMPWSIFLQPFPDTLLLVWKAIQWWGRNCYDRWALVHHWSFL